ncbi:hypothetical protein WH47_10609, partial [Habropoda laboriosa]
QRKTAVKACRSIRSFLRENVVSYDVCKYWFKRFIVNVQIALENVARKNCKSY